MEGNNSDKSVQNVGRQLCDATPIGTSQNKIVLQVRKKKGSSSVEVKSHGKDTTPKRRNVHPLAEPELKVQSFTETISSLREKYSCSLVKPSVCKGVQNKTEKKGNSVVELESQKVRGTPQKHKKCSTLASLQKRWSLREKTKSLQAQQSSLWNQYEKPETKRKRLFPELENSVQSLSLKQCKGGQVKGYCISQPQSLAPEKCSVKKRSSSVSHLSSGYLVEGTEKLVKCPRLKLAEPQETEQASGKRNRNSTAQILKKCYVNLGTTKQNSGQLCEAKCRNAVEERRERIITRAFLKAKVCEHADGKLNGRPESCVATEPPECQQDSLKKQTGIGQIVDSVSRVVSVSRVESSSKKHTNGNEVVPSAELKIKIKAYSKNTSSLFPLYSCLLWC